MALFDNVARVEINMLRFVELNDVQIKRMFAELITKAAKTAIMEKYVDIQKIIDEIIFSPEIRKEIEKIIIERVHGEIDQHIKDMFGKE